jgi:hypothetical protein
MQGFMLKLRSAFPTIVMLHKKEFLEHLLVYTLKHSV